MIINIPMNMQPSVGQTITTSLTGRVVSVRVNPIAPARETIMVELEIEDVQEEGLEEMMDKQIEYKPIRTTKVGGTYS